MPAKLAWTVGGSCQLRRGPSVKYFCHRFTQMNTDCAARISVQSVKSVANEFVLRPLSLFDCSYLLLDRENFPVRRSLESLREIDDFKVECDVSNQLFWPQQEVRP